MCLAQGPQRSDAGVKKTFLLIIMWHKGKYVEQTAKICPDYFSPIATIQGFYYSIYDKFDI